MKMAMRIISRELIKPSSPTLPHLRTLNLSLLDKLYPSGLYGTMVFFYTPSCPQGLASPERFARLLKNSLSETLVLFYPLAGRLSSDNAAVHCDDEGAYFVETRATFPLDRFLHRPDPRTLNDLIPFNDPKTLELAVNCILIVQLTVFSCGGAAITVCPSHKLVDASSQCTFLRSWTDTTLGRQARVTVPEFIGNSLIPSGNYVLPSPRAIIPPVKNCTTVRLVFDGLSIQNLKAKCSLGVSGKQPTSVEVVQALILRCAIDARSSGNRSGGSSGRSLVCQMVNLRKRATPPLPENSMGNLSWNHPVMLEGSDTELPRIVCKMRTGLQSFYRERAGKFKGDEGISMILRGLQERGEALKSKEMITIYQFTSLRGFPLYEMDFGWGKPVWVTSPSNYKNLCAILDTRSGDGIEAWITLDEQEMAVFERSDELLAYASIYPSVTSGSNICCRL